MTNVFVCSNIDCRMVWDCDPQGHCPACANWTRREGQPADRGVGWSTQPRAIFNVAEAISMKQKDVTATAWRLATRPRISVKARMMVEEYIEACEAMTDTQDLASALRVLLDADARQ